MAAMLKQHLSERASPQSLRLAAAADAELADIKQREVDRLRARALEMLQRAQRIERDLSA